MNDVLDVREDYMRDAWNIRKVTRLARTHLAGVDYDTLVGTGLSGAIVVPQLARLLGVEAMLIRKPGDGTHGNRLGNGRLGHKWVFVDDFISTGKTLRRVQETVGLMTDWPKKFETKYVGSFLYETKNPFAPPTPFTKA